VLAFFHFLNALLMILLPLGLAIYLTRRFGLDWGLFGVGAVSFISSQVLHLPFNAWVLNPFLASLGFGEGSALALGAALLGLSAGAFEGLTRYLALAFWARKARDWRQGLLFGAGHGGAEAILIGLLTLYGFLQAMALRRGDLAQLVPPEQLALAQEQLKAYWNMPPGMALMGALERVGAMTLHLSAALLVLLAIRERRPVWLAAAIGWHALLDALAVYASRRWGVLPAEGIVMLMALASLGIILALRRRLAPLVPESGPNPLPGPPEIEMEAEVPEQADLEDSRFLAE